MESARESKEKLPLLPPTTTTNASRMPLSIDAVQGNQSNAIGLHEKATNQNASAVSDMGYEEVHSMTSQSTGRQSELYKSTARDEGELRHSVKLRNADGLDEGRDRYRLMMEDLFTRHKELSTRTTRSPKTPGATSTSTVPSRRIQVLASVPEDPMTKFTGRFIQHALGFKMAEKSDSLVVEPDHEIVKQVNQLYECEKALWPDVPQWRYTQVGDSLGVAKSTVNRLVDRQFSVTQQSFLDSAATEDVVCAESELDPLESGSATPTTSDDEKWIDDERVYFHFDPVVQVHPNQSPWRNRTRIIPKPVEEEVISGGCSEQTSTTIMLNPMDQVMNLASQSPQQSMALITGDGTAPHAAFSTELDQHQVAASSYNEIQSLSSRSIEVAHDKRSQQFNQRRPVSEPPKLAQEISKAPKQQHSESLMALGIEPLIQRNKDLGEPTTRTVFAFQDRSLPFSPSKQTKTQRESKHRRHRDKAPSTDLTHCQELFSAAMDPNPMAWFDLLDERLSTCTYRSTVREKLMAQFRLKGLAKRFIPIPNGMLGLQRELEKGWDFRPKAELLMKCVVKHHVLKMPMPVANSTLVEKIYMNSIVRHPGLYKLILRRREILPQELQHFLNRIMEMTETSDRMMASITTSTTKLAAVANAAKEMDASGFMTGGPKIDHGRKESGSIYQRPSTKERLSHSSRRSAAEGSAKEELINFDVALSLINQAAKKDGAFCSLYSKETDFDKGFYTQLHNPCSNILEEVAFHLPEFAWHIRPLFEHLWATLEDDLLEKVVQNKIASLLENEERVKSMTDSPDSNLSDTRDPMNCISRASLEAKGLIPTRYDMLEWPETYETCVQMFKRVPLYFSVSRSPTPGDGTLHELLICLHMSTYYNALGSLLVNELDSWIPYLLNGLESTYSSVREETCCVLAYLVCAYRLITKLHVTSKNLLVANITFGVLSAIGHYPDSYAFYHGLLGYMLHSVPCLSTLDCILMWLPSVEHNGNNLVARDWALFVYYVLRHWPRTPFYLDTMYQKKLIKPLETSFLTKHAKRPARLALSYLVRTCHVRSALLTCWPENEDAVV